MVEFIKEIVRLPNKKGHYINLSILREEDGKPKPTVIILHGFKGFKEWGFLPYLQEKCAESGAIAVTMDFARNGIIDRDKVKYDPEVFSQMKMSDMVEDLKVAIDYIRKEIPQITDFFIAGHSMGGAISLAYARKYDEIKKIALWATVSFIDRYTPRQKELWKKQGLIEFNVSSTNQKLKLKVDFLYDFEENADTLNPTLNAAKIEIPLLVLHGTEDMTVKKEEGIQIAEAAGDKATLFLIEKTGHTFGVSHPFRGSNPQLEKAVKETIEFFGL